MNIFKKIFKTNKRKWLSSRKPGDKILVKIYAHDCECNREATIIEIKEKSIIAVMNEATIKTCAECASISDPNCWYQVTEFNKNKIKPIKKEKYE